MDIASTGPPDPVQSAPGSWTHVLFKPGGDPPARHEARAIVVRGLRGVAQPGSAPALGAGGPGFKSRRPDREKPDGNGDSICHRVEVIGLVFHVCVPHASLSAGPAT